MRAGLMVAATLACAIGAVPVEAQPDIGLEMVAEGLDSPVFAIGLPGEKNFLLIVEQSGRVRVVIKGKLRAAPFLDIRSKTSAGGERGLFSIVPSPGWPEDRTMFVNYTNNSGDTVVERYRAKRSLRKLKRNSATTVLTIEQPFGNHNGGQLHFGPDGMLYIGMGDGGSAGDPGNRAQDLTNLHGKMLRIDVSQLPFTVPGDNPVLPGVGQTAIWSLGLRNPWRFSFDPETGDMYIADVGQGAREEIDFEAAGSAGGTNWGWKVREGSAVFSGGTQPSVEPLVDPIHEYTHADGQSVTGGYVYRGTAIPELDGYYFYGDFVTERVWSFMVRNGRARNHMEWTDILAPDDGSFAISSFGQDADGEIYICSFFEGRVYKIVPQ